MSKKVELVMPAEPLPVPEILPHVFQQTVDQADVAISITDDHANILYVNPAFTRVTGYAASEVIGRNESTLSNKTTPPKVYAAMWRKISNGEPWEGRLVNRRQDGTRYLADLTITPVRDAQGVTVNFLGMHRDITGLHELECRVRNQKALIESVVDAAPVLIALLDPQGKVVLDNHEYKKLMGDLGMSEPAELMLAGSGVKLGGVDGGMPAEDPARRSGDFVFHDREVRIEREGWHSPRWFSCSGITVREDDAAADSFFARQQVSYLLLVAKEITGLRMEQEKSRMAALQAVLAEENRITGLRESLSAAIYQIEGPINVIASAVAMLNRRNQNDPMSAALAEAVQAGQAALDNLRQEIPAAPREERSSLSLNEVLRDVLQLSTGALLSAGVTVQWQAEATLPALIGYPNRLRSMFKALIDNALEAMNTKGWRERELHVTTRTLSGGIEVLIDDSGPGIAPELRLRVFEPFFSTKKGGSRHLGTGLSSAQQVVVDHGGLIEVDTTQRKGCRIRVSFPIGNGRDSA